MHQSYSFIVLKFNWAVILFILLNSFVSFGYKPTEGDITTYLGPYIYKSSFDNTNSGAVSPNLGGFGLVVLGDINSKGSLEIGMFHLNKIYLLEDTGRYIAEQTGLIHISMGYRRWFTDRFSSSLSLATGYPMGEVKVIHSDFASGSESKTSARDKVEYGFDISLMAELVEISNFVLYLDARYFLSLTAKKNESANHYGVLLGFKYLIQEKRADKSKSTTPFHEDFNEL